RFVLLLARYAAGSGSRDIRPGLLPVRVPAGTSTPGAALRSSTGGGPHARPGTLVGFHARGRAPGATGAVCRAGARADGDSQRLRSRLVLRRDHVHHGDLPGLVLTRRSGHCHKTLRIAHGRCAPSARPGEVAEGSRPVRRGGNERATGGSLSPERRVRPGGDDVLRLAPVLRLLPAGAAAPPVDRAAR